MAIHILETTTTIKMSLVEAQALRRLLGMLPRNKPTHPTTAIDTTRIGDGEWVRLMALYDAMSEHFDATKA